MFGATETDTRASGSDVSSMAMALIFLLTEMCMLGSIRMANLKVMVSTLGATVVTMWANSEGDLSMVKVNGEEVKIITLINMKESTKMIKRTVTGNSLGLLVMYIKVDIKMMKEKVLVK